MAVVFLACLAGLVGAQQTTPSVSSDANTGNITLNGNDVMFQVSNSLWPVEC